MNISRPLRINPFVMAIGLANRARLKRQPSSRKALSVLVSSEASASISETWIVNTFRIHRLVLAPASSPRVEWQDVREPIDGSTALSLETL